MVELPNLRDQQRQFTRVRLMQAAEVVLAKSGYQAATIDDIVKEAGASRATFYLHFRNKTEVVVALLEARSADLGQRRYHELAQILLSEDIASSRRQLRTWLAEWLPVWRDGLDVSRAIYEASVLEPEVEEAALRDSERYILALEAFFRSLPASRRKLARARALVLEVMSRRAYVLASVGLSPLDDEALIDFLTDTWWYEFREIQLAAG